MKSYIREIEEYTFSNKPIDEDNPIIDMFVNEIASVHGVAGKFMEKIICSHFGIDVLDEKIHDFDGKWFDRPVEIKLETRNKTSKMNMLASYSNSKMPQYKDVRPIIINCGMEPTVGKLFYVAITDTNLLSEKSELWSALSKKAPRTKLSNYLDDDLVAIKVPYVNKELCYQYKDPEFSGDRRCIQPKLWDLLVEKTGL